MALQCPERRGRRSGCSRGSQPGWRQLHLSEPAHARMPKRERCNANSPDRRDARALDSALTDRSPCLVATASVSGMPDVPYRGSVMGFDASTLRSGSGRKAETLTNIRENAHVCVFYLNATTRI